jgi:hypothetical protein
MDAPLILFHGEAWNKERLARAKVPAETLLRDHRAGPTPAQRVERKLWFLLKGNALPVSLGHTTSPLPLRPQRPKASTVIFARE